MPPAHRAGGPSNHPVGRYTLDRDQDATGLFCRAFLGKPLTGSCPDTPPMLITEPMAAVEDRADAVAENPAGIGLQEFMARRNARAILLGNACNTGIEPNLSRIMGGKYPLVMALHLHTTANHRLTQAVRHFCIVRTNWPTA